MYIHIREADSGPYFDQSVKFYRCLWDIFKYRGCFVQSQFSKNDLEAKQSWIYAVLLLSVGPVGGGPWWWDIFNYRLCCVQSLFSDGPS